MPNGHLLEIEGCRGELYLCPTTAAAATGELEVGNAGVPAETAGYLAVFLGVPESTVIGWINSHRAVVPPTGWTGLRAGAVHDQLLCFHCSQRIARYPPREEHRRKDG